MRVLIVATVAGLSLLFPAKSFAKTIKGACSITIDGRTNLNLKRGCNIDVSAGGSFSIGVDQKPLTYFAYVEKSDTDHATVSWNETPESVHAQTQLGDNFTRVGACWVNLRAKVCARR